MQNDSLPRLRLALFAGRMERLLCRGLSVPQQDQLRRSLALVTQTIADELKATAAVKVASS